MPAKYLSEMNFRIVLFLWFLNYSSAQDDCGFTKSVAVGETVALNSPNLPGRYSPGQQCRWYIDCPLGYNCRMDCRDIRIPNGGSSCSLDRFLVSRTGDPQLTGADAYCNITTLSVTSINQRLINRIVGGEETGVNEYTMMATLADIKRSQIKCGAVIVTNRRLLTAASCLMGATVTADFNVLVGEHDVTTRTDTPATQVLGVASFTIHPSYSDFNNINDIGIVKVDKEIQFNEFVLPVCLPFSQKNNDFAGSKVTAVGWGTTKYGGSTSNVPRKVDLDVLQQSTCRSRGVNVTDRQMCTFTPGKDSCQGDAGGPLLWTDPSNGLIHIVGIIIYGRLCASNMPGINTRVTSYLEWIVNNTQPEVYCMK